jgi:hypothetical protein
MSVEHLSMHSTSPELESLAGSCQLCISWTF